MQSKGVFSGLHFSFLHLAMLPLHSKIVQIKSFSSIMTKQKQNFRIFRFSINGKYIYLVFRPFTKFLVVTPLAEITASPLGQALHTGIWANQTFFSADPPKFCQVR